MESGPGIVRIEAVALGADHMVQTVRHACGGECKACNLYAGLCARDGEDVVCYTVDDDQRAWCDQLAELAHIEIFCDVGHVVAGALLIMRFLYRNFSSAFSLYFLSASKTL